MCKVCSASRRDVLTDLLVCEECGPTFENLEGAEPRAPLTFVSSTPPCRAISEVPSRRLSYAVDMSGSPGPEENEKKH